MITLKIITLQIPLHILLAKVNLIIKLKAKEQENIYPTRFSFCGCNCSHKVKVKDTGIVEELGLIFLPPIALLPIFYRYRNYGAEKLAEMPKVTELKIRCVSSKFIFHCFIPQDLKMYSLNRFFPNKGVYKLASKNSFCKQSSEIPFCISASCFTLLA